MNVEYDRNSIKDTINDENLKKKRMM